MAQHNSLFNKKNFENSVPLHRQDDDQVHGDDTIMKFLHTSKDVGGFIGPAVLGARVSPSSALRCSRPSLTLQLMNTLGTGARE